MRIVGLVGSRRKGGNVEILAKEALVGAQSCGAEVELLRLTDLKIESCRGCMACVFKEARCPLDDDLYFLLRMMERADGIVLGAPVYFFSVPGIIKLIMDRLLVVKPGQFAGKKAVTFGSAGKAKWARLFLPQLNQLPLVAGLEVVDSTVFSAPGPGEVLLDPANPQRANELGRTLVACLNGQPKRAPATSVQCPSCFGTLFMLTGPTSVECAVCYTRGDIVSEGDGIAVRFDEGVRQFRFCGEDSMASHLDNWVKKTGPHFRDRIREVLAKRKPYETLPIPWIKPDRQS